MLWAFICFCNITTKVSYAHVCSLYLEARELKKTYLFYSNSFCNFLFYLFSFLLGCLHHFIKVSQNKHPPMFLCKGIGWMLHSSLGITPCKVEENYLFHSFLSYLESIIGKRERKKKTLDKPKILCQCFMCF